MDSGKLEYWRNYFRGAKSSIFEVIENAILVASLDCPGELKLYRGRIAEKLYTCQCSHFFRGDHAELVVPKKENGDGFGVEKKKKGSNNRLDSNGGELGDRGCKKGLDGSGGELGGDRGCKNRLVVNGGELEDRGGKNRVVVNGGKLEGGGTVETKVDDGGKNENGDMFLTPVSMLSDLEAEALTDEIDQENLTVGEVLRIKEVLENSEDQSNDMLFESLRKLQLMALSIHILKATEIGKVVNPLRKHRSKRICQLAHTIIIDWRNIVDEWVDAAKLVEENITELVNPSVVDDGLDDGLDNGIGLPLPPLDVGAFFTSPISRMELSQFFDGIDDDGNPQSGAELDKNHDSGKKHSRDNRDMSKQKSHLPKEPNVIVKDTGVAMKKESVVKVTKRPNNESGAEKLPKQNLEKKVIDETKFHQNSDMVIIKKRPLTGQHNNLKFSDKDAAVEEKLEATRRKLHEGYQQAQNAKKQRTIQFMDLHELPKQELGRRNPHLRKQKNHRRHFTNKRS